MQMSRIRLFTLLAVAAALAGCADRAPNPAGSDLDRAAPAAARSVGAGEAQGRYMVTLNTHAGDVAGLARRTVAEHGGTLHHLFDEPGQKVFAASLPEAAVAALRRNPQVAEVRPELVFTADGPITQSGATWGLDRVDQRDRPLNGTYVYGWTGAGVWAYVIDTGIRPTHGDFGGRASIGYDARPYDARGGLPYGRDCYGHGTHVAGTIAGTTYGVAKGVNVVGVRVGYECTQNMYESDIIAGIYWVRDQKVAYPSRPMVANLSLGGPASPTLDNAVTTLISAGVTAVVSAGNANANACNSSPSRVGGALTVGASTSADARASFSNYGSCLDLFAPGENITSLSYASDNGTTVMSGTSMASPHVAGTAALYLQENPGATPATVHSAIRSRATPNRLTSVGSGSVNLLLYTRSVVNAGIDGESYIYVADDNNWTYHTWTASATGGRAPYHYYWEVSYPQAGQGWAHVGSDSPSVTFGVMAMDGDISLRVTVTDDDGVVGQGFLTVDVAGPGGGCGPQVLIC
jgi:subtilisin family serine protease